MNSLIRKYCCALSVVLLAGASPALSAENSKVPAPEPFPPVPNQAQLDWHKAEYRMFIHFGMRTYYPNGSNRGTGKEDPKKFDPVHFDAQQWVNTCKAGGFEGIVLVCKHHRGFCNWPTDTTDYCVKSAPWKNGKGDIVKDLFEACRKNDISIGFYVSILDQHYRSAGSQKYDNYGEFYYNQIKELSTRYGRIDEYWFDGLGAEDMKVDYKKIAGLIRETQPDAVVYDSGKLVEYLPDRCLAWPGNHGDVEPDQNYRNKVGDTVRWYPNEPSIILQGGWFHQGKPIVGLDRIINYYLKSTGHGVTPLMNVPPNQDGLFDENSVERLREFKAWVDRLNSNDLAQAEGVLVTANTVRGKAKRYRSRNVVDGKYDTYYATDDDVKNAMIEINLGKVQEIDGFILQEYIPLGQRVDGYSLECFVNGKWQRVFSGKKIGYKRIILEGYATAANKTFPPTDRIRLKIKNALACPLISTFHVVGKME